MNKTDNTVERQVQVLVLDYFQDMDDKTVCAVVDSFVYATPITDRNSKVSSIIEKFLSDNGLTVAYTNYVSDYVKKDTVYFLKSSLSEVDMIEKVRNAMLNLSFNRYRRLVSKRDNDFKFLKKTVLEVFECLNNNENYIYGKEEDEVLVDKVKAMKS